MIACTSFDELVTIFKRLLVLLLNPENCIDVRETIEKFSEEIEVNIVQNRFFNF